MRRKDESKKVQIMEFINDYYGRFSRAPAVRDITRGTGIPVTTVHRYLNTMQESGLLAYNGRRSISTERMTMEGTEHSMPVRGYVACGPGQEEEERILEYIRMPESLVGRGTFFALIAKGESMTGAGIWPGDTVVVDRDRKAEPGDPVVALCDGRSNLKLLEYDETRQRYVLRSCNPDKKRYPDIYPDRLEIQGVAVCVTHRLARPISGGGN